MNDRLNQIGRACKQQRRKLNLKQITVAKETGYSVKNISGFETGRVNNAIILLWYLKHGLDISKIGGVKYGKTQETQY